MEGNYSLADMAALTNDGIGGGNSVILIILFLLIFGGGNLWGNRQGEFGQYATAASQNELLLGQKFDALGQKVNAIGDGICSSTYALNNTIQNEGRSLQGQLAECCCTNQRNVDSVRYDMSNFAAQINANIDNKFAALEKSGLEQRIAEQAAQINQLQLAQAMCGVVKYPNSSTYAFANPYCGCNANI